MHGIGNDYVYIDATKEDIRLSAEQIAFLADRNFGIGGDGVIFIRNSEKADFMMDMYNADGSWSEMCGNGIRCVGKYVYDYGLTNKTNPNIETGKGVLALEMTLEQGAVSQVKVNMGAPILQPSQVPVQVSTDMNQAVQVPIEIEGKEYFFTAVSMGNPHAVIYVDDPDTFPVHEIGKQIENHEFFPNRVNVEFVSKKGKNYLYQRTWERGTGETLACGTGACAVLVASVLNVKTERKATIDLRGGTLQIEWSENGDVYMTGGAETVFEGEIVLK